jgi:hypothetical protein
MSFFINNTNATKMSTGTAAISPESVGWNSFTEYCKQTFNYSIKDLVAFNKGQQVTLERMPIKELFKKATANKKAVLKYIKLFAEEVSESDYAELSQAYKLYMGKRAVDSSYNKLGQNSEFSYSAWLTKITDPNGPIKLTKEEVLRYFNEAKA